MRLLPDIVYEGCKISVQAPYTLNGRLIKKVDYESNSLGGRYYFIDDNNFGVSIRKTELRSAYNILKESFLQTVFYDEDGNRQYFLLFDEYIDDIRRQCLRLENDENYCVLCSSRLLNQGRSSMSIGTDISAADITASTISSERIVYPSSVSQEPVSYVTATNIRGNRRYVYVNPTTTTVHFDSNNSYFNIGLFQTEEKYIHSYNYKPEYIKHYMPDEDSSTLLLGAEIEVAGNANEKTPRDDIVKTCIQIMNGSKSDKEDLIYSTHDSSVQIELDTMPCSLEYHKTMNYKKMFHFLDKQGYKGHDCNSAGLHIHADRNYLGKTPSQQQFVICKILYILEKFNDEICVIARRNNGYSKFVGNGKNEDSIVELYGKYNKQDKHVALNLKHSETIEFRCFKSTLKYETFILTLEFVKDIIDYAKSINIEEIELIKWSDLMDTFSDELKKYYNERLKKEKNKEKKIDKSEIASGEFASSIDTVWIELADRFADTVDSSIVSSLDFVIAANNIAPDNNPIKQKKKEIRSLKKRIKSCTNYMERKRLNEDLTKAQKELKKLKKNSRNNSVDVESVSNTESICVNNNGNIDYANIYTSNCNTITSANIADDISHRRLYTIDPWCI